MSGFKSKGGAPVWNLYQYDPVAAKFTDEWKPAGKFVVAPKNETFVVRIQWSKNLMLELDRSFLDEEVAKRVADKINSGRQITMAWWWKHKTTPGA